MNDKDLNESGGHEPAETDFAHYGPPSESSADSLYGLLLDAGNLAKYTMLAVQFIEGRSPFAPGQYLTGQQALGDASQRLLALEPLLHGWLADSQASPDSLEQQIETLFGVPDRTRMCGVLTASSYQAEVDGLWQSYFALQIMPGYQRAWMASIHRMLVAQHVLRGLFLSPSVSVTPELVRRLLAAAVVLPSALFPVPSD